MLTRPALRAALVTLVLAPACASPATPTVEIVAPPPAPSALSRVQAQSPPSDHEGSRDDVGWGRSEPEAVARARRERRPMVLDFTAEWCGACKELDRDTYSDAGVKATLQRFVRVKVDVTSDEDAEVVAIKSRYRIIGLPTVVLLDSSGKEQGRFTELVGPDQLVSVLSRIK